MGWVGLGQSADGLGWIGSHKMDPWTTLRDYCGMETAGSERGSVSDGLAREVPPASGGRSRRGVVPEEDLARPGVALDGQQRQRLVEAEFGPRREEPDDVDHGHAATPSAVMIRTVVFIVITAPVFRFYVVLLFCYSSVIH